MFPDAKILDIDLTLAAISEHTLSGDIYRLYPGGSALGLYLLLKEGKPGIDALAPENLLIFAVSPLTGLPISGLSRLNVTTKSPLTGAIADSQSGGFFPAYLKINGWDAIIIRGKAKKPVYIYISGNQVEIKSAEKIWGRVTGEAEQLIRDDLSETDLEIAQIGPAGENLVRFACIISMCSRANGRNGTGAVMGSKNLKAVVVKKSGRLAAFDQPGAMALAKEAVQRLRTNEALSGLATYGTDGDLQGFSEAGFLPTRNWTSGWFPGGDSKITGTTMADTILKARDTCFGCVVRCKRIVEIPGKVNPLYGGPEYETAACFGSYCAVESLKTISIANQLCNMYGLDTISCGATIAFAMECYENSVLDGQDTGGLELKFGNDAVLLDLIELIAARKGIGDMLAEGSARAAKMIGKGAGNFVMAVKGQEMPAHMPQFKPAVGLIYAVSPIGADHQSSEHDPFLMLPPDSQSRQWLAQLGIWKGYDNSFELDDEKIRFAYVTQCFFALLDTLCLCQFAWGPAWELFGPADLIELCKCGLGWKTSLAELLQVGERRINMMRFFNAREGFNKSMDYLPARMFEPMPEGPSQGRQLDRENFQQAILAYYRIAGWDEATGNPAEETLVKLSLGWLLEHEVKNEYSGE